MFVIHTVTVCVCVCVLSSHLFSASDLMWTAGVTQEEGHTGFLHLPSAVLASIFLARRIQPHSFPLSTVKLNFVYLDPRINRRSQFVRKKLSSCDCAEIRTHVPTPEGFEIITN